MLCRFAALLLVVCSTAVAAAQQPLQEIPIDAPPGWRKERFPLPPSFARDMTLKGAEELRFSPGVFQPKSETFFSYVIVFRLQDKPTLDEKTLTRELLVYFRGLAKAVGRGQVKTDGIALKVAKIDKPARKNAREFLATLEWVEPFATKQPQALRIEIDAWNAPKSAHTWVFLCVSPKEPKTDVWKQLHAIRDGFFKQNSPDAPASND